MDAVGTHNRYGIGSVDQNAMMVVSQAMYGAPLFSFMPDVDDCKFFLFLGMNPAESKMCWIGAVANGWPRVLAAVTDGAEMVVVDPRRTPTAEHATTHLAIRPGTDWAFLLGVVKIVVEEALYDPATLDGVAGFDEVVSLAADASMQTLAERCDIPVETITSIARRFAAAPTAMAVTRTGTSQTHAGTLAEWLTHVINAITDRWDRPGGRRFEKGYIDTLGLLDRLLPPTVHRSRVAGREAIAGYHSLAELAGEILVPGSGQIRAMIIESGNPVVAGPNGRELDEAFEQLDLLVAVDLVQRESHRHADWLIPGSHFLERTEVHPGFASLQDEPYVHFSERAVAPPPGLRLEWEFYVDLALALRKPLFGYRGVNSLVKASRAVARITRRPQLAFNPTWIWRLLVATGRTVRWKDIVSHPHGLVYGTKEYGNARTALRTPDKKIVLAPGAFVAECRRLLTTAISSEFELPLTMVTRRRPTAMNSWLNESPSALKRLKSNVVEIHPTDAAEVGIGDGDRVRVTSAVDAIELSAVVSDAMRPGVIAIEHGWGSNIYDPVGGGEPVVHGVNRNLLTGTDVDPLSHTATFNATRVRIEPL